MKIAIDVSQMAYSGTGVGRYTHDLVEALLDLDSPHQFLLWAGTLRQHAYFQQLARTKPWSKAQWFIQPIPPKLAGIIFNLTGTPFERLVGSYDLLHTSDWSEPASHAPKITTVHDLVFARYPSTVDPLIRRTQEKRLNRLRDNDTFIIADSLSTQLDLQNLFHIDSTRIRVIYPGINQCYHPQSKKEIDRVKKKYKLPDQYLLSVGTQEPRKNLERLVKASELLNLPLILVGRYGWGDKTRTVGFIPDNDLPAMYAGATVFAYPSLYEGFGFPVLEAMACGTPVVTSNISSLPEVAGDAGILVNPLSVKAITRGIEQAITSREKLIQKGYNQVKKFSWRATAQKLVSMYELVGTS